MREHALIPARYSRGIFLITRSEVVRVRILPSVHGIMLRRGDRKTQSERCNPGPRHHVFSITCMAFTSGLVAPQLNTELSQKPRVIDRSSHVWQHGLRFAVMPVRDGLGVSEGLGAYLTVGFHAYFGSYEPPQGIPAMPMWKALITLTFMSLMLG